MKVQKTPFAIAAAALCVAAPLAADAAPTVSWRAPASGATISQSINQTSACEVTGLRIDRVVFSIRRSGASAWTALNTEQNSPWRCNIDVSRFTTGAYTLRAVAYDTANASATTTRSINISNGTTTNTPPTLSITSPTSGQTVSGTVSCAASASDSNGITRVQFFLDGSSTALSTDTSSPYTCSFNSATLTNGSHTLRAVATDGLGATQSTQVSFNVSNGTSGGTTGPAVSFTAPANGATIGSTINQSANCQVSATTVSGRTIRQVQFFLDSTALNTELNTPYQCNINPANHTNGAHVLRARVTDSSGATGEAQISVNITNGIAAPNPGTNTPPSVNLSVNSTLSGTAAYSASATDNVAVKQVEFFLANGSTQTLLSRVTTPPYQGTFNTAQHANGGYTLSAVATDDAGLQATSQRSVTISNGGTTNPPPSSGLPSTGTRAVATFESLGLYWTGSNAGNAGCTVRYRKASESQWKDGLALWYDSRNSECRGSLVHLEPGTDYVVQLGLPGQAPSRELTARTWDENFPIARTVHVASGSQQLNITEGGTPSGYVLYTPAPGTQAVIDVANNADYNIAISAPYVIVRGFTLRGARRDGIRLLAGAHDVVIEDNDISGWGRFRTTLGNGWQVGMDYDAAVRAICNTGFQLERTVVQRNRIHDPRYTTNSWDFGHPQGPQGMTYSFCGGNHVIRYNEVYSTNGNKYLNDGLGGEDNFSNNGFPNADSDIYGNRISHVWDDGIEAEGSNRNVRIWGNYLDRTATGIATTSTSAGPVYIFRNVYNRSQKMALQSLDSADRLNFAKSGSDSTYGNGRRYVFHNTLLQATQSGLSWPLGAGGGIIAGGTSQPTTNTVSRNNILHVWRSSWDSIRTQGGGSNDLDHDLRNGSINAYAGAETNGIVATPIYAPGHGWQSEAGGRYQLERSSRGYDEGLRLPNFNDGYTGSGPDMGAHEADTPDMRFGVGGAGSTWTSAPPAGTSTAAADPGTSTAAADPGTSSGGGGGACSTISCAAQ